MKDTTLFETKYWKVILTDDQYNLGRSYIKCKRECPTLGELSKEESDDLHKNVIKKLESSIKKAFNPSYFNWECLLNNDFKGEGRKPHVRFHFRPRYKETVKFAGETFVDPVFGDKYILADEKFVSDEAFNKIKEEILKNI